MYVQKESTNEDKVKEISGTLMELDSLQLVTILKAEE